jgi:anti-sigma B factor antagonist
VTPDQPIVVGVFPGFSWIRCEGKGSFANSPNVKSFGDERIAAGEKLLVVDLGACTGMDSTFMGTMAGLAARISSKSGGALHVADAGDKNRQSLEDLGLDFMMEIDPPAADWRGRLDEVRSELKPQCKQGALPSLDRARHVLEAHKTLSRLNEANASEFETVVKTLEEQIIAPPKPHNGSER